MELLTTSNEIENKLCLLINSYKNISFASAWASANSRAFETLMKNKNKIYKIVVGIHFYQTNPNFIKEFIDNKKVKFITNPSGIFHPKIYLFSNNKNDWQCLVGSANFTKSAMERNTEIMTCITSSDINSKEIYYKLVSEIENYDKRAIIFTNEDFVLYQKIWDKKLKIKNNLQDKFSGNSDITPIYKSKIITLDWSMFFNKVKNDKNTSFDMRLSLLKKAKQYFSEQTFTKMSEINRKRIAGTIKWDDSINWHFFGNMVNNRFKERIKDDHRNISKSLGHIDLEGEIAKEDYMAFIDYFIANKDKKLGYGVTTISRLLAIKRPDVFFCLTGGNETYLYKDFGIKKIKSNEYERYWDEIIERIHQSSWYNTKVPDNLIEKELWENRVAMLDSMFYDGTIPSSHLSR